MYIDITKTLSPSMKKALKIAILQNNVDANLSTKHALLNRNLCTEDFKLTEYGYYTAITLLDLSKQCSVLNFKKEIIIADRPFKKPEIYAVEYFKEQGKEAYFVENTIAYIFFKIILFDKLYTYMNENRFVWSKCYYLEAYDDFLNTVDDELIEYVKNLSEDQFVKNLDLLMNAPEKNLHQTHSNFGITTVSIEPNLFPIFDELSKDFFMKLFKYLDRSVYQKMVEIFFKSLGQFWRGWPDLIAFDNNTVEFVEIKTTDKFHFHQIITLDNMVHKAGINFSVLVIK